MKTNNVISCSGLLLVAGLLLGGCGADNSTDTAANTTPAPADTPAPAAQADKGTAASDLMPSRQQSAMAAAVNLPDNALEVGTDVKTLVKLKTHGTGRHPADFVGRPDPAGL
ncbi:MAG: hypothetical protein R3E95_11600 [Thiolinea sp.]